MIFSFPEPKTGWDIIASFVAVLTPLIIGLLGVYIAFQQWKTNHLKLKFDLYDRRLKVYDLLMQFLDNVGGLENPTIDLELYRKFRETGFLFNSEIESFLYEIYDKASELAMLQIVEPEAEPAVIEDKEILRDTLIDWGNKQRETAKRIFRPFLSLS